MRLLLAILALVLSAASAQGGPSAGADPVSSLLQPLLRQALRFLDPAVSGRAPRSGGAALRRHARGGLHLVREGGESHEQ